MTTSQQVIDETVKWIEDVVVGCNFCPFASRVLKKQSVEYKVEFSADLSVGLEAVLKIAEMLDNESEIETSFLIFPNTYQRFDQYLLLFAKAEKCMTKKGYEGIYQMASFHPLYQFANVEIDDPANYTNRSIYPMIHFLREKSIDTALKSYPSPENIPKRNINFARDKGLAYMMMLRDTCIKK
jgi:hypothetical protein